MAYYNADCEVNESSTADFAEEEQIVDDLSIVPLEKDSFAICELCGRIGRRGQFYPRNNKFCSLRCHTSKQRRKHCSYRFKLMEGAEHMAGLIPLEPLPQLQQWHATLNDIQAGPIKQPAAQVANSYEWKDELFGCDFLAAPVSLFKHAPLHEMWDNTFEGMKVEVKNTDCDNYSEKMNDFFWVATVLKVKGYMGLLRYEGFGSDDSKDFWVNLCCSEVHPVGWCATRGKPLIPPRSIEDKYTDWKKFLVKQLTGARTLPANFYTKLNDSLKSRFSIGSIMEVVDKNRISQVKVASVCEIIGKRLHVKYYDSSPEDNGFWCHEDSPLIHPVGWAFRVGHPLDAPQSYCQRVATGRFLPNDTTPEMFYKYPTNEPPLFVEGMKLEAIDPLNLSAVCAATVMQILNEGYMMIRIDCYPADASGADWFCYHQRSPCIFPVGFALANNIPLVPPAGYTPEVFSWEEYLCACGGRAATRTLFAARGHLVSHGFVCGMRLECADLMDPRLVCVATVARVVADLLKVHFDGWGSEYDQWLWAHSTDMYPVGWCRAVAHRLEGPMQPPPRAVRKPPAKSQRRRRRHQVPKVQPQPPNTTEESSQNSDIGDTKSLSPPTSVSEISADVESRPDDMVKMDVDDSTTVETLQERLSEVTNQESMSIPTDASQDSSVHMDPVSPDTSSPSENLIPRFVNTCDTSSPSDKLIPLLVNTSDTTNPSDMLIPRLVNTSDTSCPSDILIPRLVNTSDTSCPSDILIPRLVNTSDMSCPSDMLIPRLVNTSDTSCPSDMLIPRLMDTSDASCPSDMLIPRLVNTSDTSCPSDMLIQRLVNTSCPSDMLIPRLVNTSDTSCPSDMLTPRLVNTSDTTNPSDNLIPRLDNTSDTTNPSEKLIPRLDNTSDTSSLSDKLIPRLVNTSGPLDALNVVEPDQWTTADVARFLTVNDCQPYCDNFTNITGPMLLQLSKDEIIELLEMKVGPSLKIFDLIQQLKCKIKQPQCRSNFK